MHPILLRIGPLDLYTYGALLAIAFLVAIFLATRAAERVGVESQFVADLGLVVIISAIVGARVFHILFYDLQNTLANPGELLKFRQTGLVFYGGLVFAVAASFIFSRWKHVSFLLVADIAAPSIAVGQAIGRLGCLMSGCCYGRPASIPWAIKLPYLNYARHPTQVYEMLATLAIFAGLIWFRKRKTIDGQIVWLYLVLYAAARFVIEFFRGDNPRIFMGMTLSQIIGLLVLVVTVPLGYTLLFSSTRRRAPADAGEKSQ